MPVTRKRPHGSWSDSRAAAPPSGVRSTTDAPDRASSATEGSPPTRPCQWYFPSIGWNTPRSVTVTSIDRSPLTSRAGPAYPGLVVRGRGHDPSCWSATTRSGRAEASGTP